MFGLGYTGGRLAAALRARGWSVAGTRRRADGEALGLDDPEVGRRIAQATHLLSSVPPDAQGRDPVLERWGQALRVPWIGYLSSTGVYGDAKGAWVDESAPLSGRRDARIAADAAWRAMGDNVHIFRLPGIYGPGRSALDRVRDGRAVRVDAPNHRFSRIHVDDIVGAILAAIERPRPGIYNIADDLPATSAAVIEQACDLLGRPYPPIQPIDALDEPARGFYAERRQVANGKMKRDLGYRLRYPSYREGLRACMEDRR